MLADTEVTNCALKPYFYIFIDHFLYINLCNYCVNFLFCCVDGLKSASLKGFEYTHWIGLNLSFMLSWVLDPLVHDRLQNVKTSDNTFGHDINLLSQFYQERVCLFFEALHR